MKKPVKRAVLAYSGGLDTSIIVPWLKEHYGCEVICYCSDVGQGAELDGLEARGLGLLRALDLDEAAPFGAAQLVAAAREQGLLLVRGGERAVRLLPPLNVSLDEITEALGALDRALTSLQNSGDVK